ncbi:MAG: hypothetical protein ACRDFQ_05530 [Anaerolineales bacterium]
MDRIKGIDRRTLGTALIYIGVSVWLVYFYLLSTDREVSIIPFVIAHVTLVVSGARLRGRSPKEHSEPTADARLRRISRILITLGVLAWAPYFYITRAQGIDTAIGPFLAAHLTGVLSGIGLRVYLELK